MKKVPVDDQLQLFSLPFGNTQIWENEDATGGYAIEPCTDWLPKKCLIWEIKSKLRHKSHNYMIISAIKEMIKYLIIMTYSKILTFHLITVLFFSQATHLTTFLHQLTFDQITWLLCSIHDLVSYSKTSVSLSILFTSWWTI